MYSYELQLEFMISIVLAHTIHGLSTSTGGLVFPGSFIHTKDENGNAVFGGAPRDLFTEENFRKFERAWDDGRVATAFFRGENVVV